MSWFVLVKSFLFQEAPRWKHCVLETERGFDTVLTHLLRDRTEHREVRRHQGDLGQYKSSRDYINKADMKYTEDFFCSTGREDYSEYFFLPQTHIT